MRAAGHCILDTTKRRHRSLCCGSHNTDKLREEDLRHTAALFPNSMNRFKPNTSFSSSINGLRRNPPGNCVILIFGGQSLVPE